MSWHSSKRAANTDFELLYACTMSACHAAVARLTASHLLCLPGVSLTVHICERP
jgi:hypothetical protein